MDGDALKSKIASVMKQLEVLFLNNEITLNIAKTSAVSFPSSHCRLPYKPLISYNNNNYDNDIIQSDTKKRKLLKNPTKIEEIQKKKIY